MAGRSNKYARAKRLRGDRAAICDGCDVRYLRSQLVRGPDGLLRCFGPGTLNDAKGRTAVELDELQAQAAEQQSQSGDYLNDDGGRFDDTGRELPFGGGDVG